MGAKKKKKKATLARKAPPRRSPVGSAPRRRASKPKRPRSPAVAKVKKPARLETAPRSARPAKPSRGASSRKKKSKKKIGKRRIPLAQAIRFKALEEIELGIPPARHEALAEAVGSWAGLARATKRGARLTPEDVIRLEIGNRLGAGVPSFERLGHVIREVKEDLPAIMQHYEDIAYSTRTVGRKEREAFEAARATTPVGRPTKAELVAFARETGIELPRGATRDVVEMVVGAYLVDPANVVVGSGGGSGGYDGGDDGDDGGGADSDYGFIDLHAFDLDVDYDFDDWTFDEGDLWDLFMSPDGE